MLDAKILPILVCPENKTPLHLAEGNLLTKINALIGDGKMINRGGQVVDKPLGEGLVREDGRYLYPIRQNIPLLIADEAIAL